LQVDDGEYDLFLY